MNNLQGLQLACLMVNLPYPSTLAANSLGRQQDSLLKFLDDAQNAICAEHDWWFLQKTWTSRTYVYQSGTDGAVGSGPAFSSASAAFDSGMPNYGKLTIAGSSGWSGGLGGGTRDKDVARVSYASATSVNIVSAWNRGTHAGTSLTWKYGQDDVLLATDCDRVSSVCCSRYNNSERHVFLQAVSEAEMERIRSNRTTYIDTGQPWYYCVERHAAGSASSSEYQRTMKLDPFPDKDMVLVYRGMKKPTSIYSASTVTLTVPDQWSMSVVLQAVLDWYASQGQGAQAGPAGPTIAQRMEETAKKLEEMKRQMMAQPRIANEDARMDPSSLERSYMTQQYGRTF